MAEAGASAAVCDDGARKRSQRQSYVHKVKAVEAACRRIEAGVTLAEACRCPTAPPWSTMQWWLGRYPELRAMVDAAQAVAAEAYGARRAYHRWNPKVAAEVLARVEAGRGLDEVCAQPDMPAYSTVMRWIKERPDFYQAYMLARATQADRLFDLAWRIALEAEEGTTRTARLKIQTLKWRCAKLAPRRYGTQRAQPAEDAAPDVAPAAAKPVVSFEIRRFAATPDGQVVETTRAVRGLSPEAVADFHRAIREGRISLAELDARLAAGEPPTVGRGPADQGADGAAATLRR